MPLDGAAIMRIIAGKAGRIAIKVPPAVARPTTDFVRQGAAELDLLMRLVELQQSPGPIGIVGVGNRHGIFQAGVHRALEMAVREGIPVVRLAQNGEPAAAGSCCVFINGGTLSVAEAELLLKQCLAEFGPLPQANDAISQEMSTQLARFQAVFDRGISSRLAVNGGRE